MSGFESWGINPEAVEDIKANPTNPEDAKNLDGVDTGNKEQKEQNDLKEQEELAKQKNKITELENADKMSTAMNVPNLDSDIFPPIDGIEDDTSKTAQANIGNTEGGSSLNNEHT